MEWMENVLEDTDLSKVVYNTEDNMLEKPAADLFLSWKTEAPTTTKAEAQSAVGAAKC